MDVGVISDGSGEDHYFINVADIHLYGSLETLIELPNT